MTIVYRRVCEIRGNWVCYDYPDDPTRIIWRTVQEHVEATNTQPTIEQIVKFQMFEDYNDGPSFSYVR